MSVLWFLFSLGITAVFAGHGYRKQSLSPEGAATALVVGTVIMFCGPRFGFTLLAFYFTSSQLTKYKTELKAKVEEDYRKNGQRRPVQVLVNSIGGCCLAMAAKYYQDRDHWALDMALAAYLGHFACCCADTWSSELGILSEEHPVLITTGKVVPRGTNGALSRLGTLAGVAGGLFTGLVFWSVGSWDNTNRSSSLSLSLLPLGALLGLLGTLLDSLLGGLFQYTGYSSKLGRVVGQPGGGVVHISGRPLLSNDAVNFISANLTAAVGALIVLYGKANYPYER